MDHRDRQMEMQSRMPARWVPPTTGVFEGRRDGAHLQRLLAQAELGTLTEALVAEDVTVEQLKLLLRIRGLPATGSKRVLIERLRTPASTQRIQPLHVSNSDLAPTSHPRPPTPGGGGTNGGGPASNTTPASLNASLSPRYYGYGSDAAGPSGVLGPDGQYILVSPPQGGNDGFAQQPPSR